MEVRCGTTAVPKVQEGKNKGTKQLSGRPSRESSKHKSMYICCGAKCI